MDIPNTSTFVDALLTVLVILLGMLATYLKTHVAPKLKADLGAQQYQVLNEIAHSAVLATEKTISGEDVKSHTKLADALRRAQDLAYQHGFEITDDQMTTLIEKFVLLLHENGNPGTPLVGTNTIQPALLEEI